MTENEIATVIVDAAVKEHKVLGPGLLESVYERVLCHELRGFNKSDVLAANLTRQGFHGINILRLAWTRRIYEGERAGFGNEKCRRQPEDNSYSVG